MMERRAFAAAALAAAAFLAVLALRQLGALQPVELAVYDRFLAGRAGAAPEGRVVLVGATEGDIAKLGWPASDAVLARLLGAIFAQSPRAVGLDIYRDAPRPPGTRQLESLMKKRPDLVAVRKIGSPGEPGVAAPPALAKTDQVGFADVASDPGGIVRRGMLFLDDDEGAHTSFPLRLALLYLKAEGIAPAPGEPDETHMRLGKVTIAPFGRDDGGYVGADDGGYQFLLDFAGGPVPFQRYSFTEVLEKAVPADAFRNRIVIVGVTAPSVKDFFDTPFSREEGSPTVHGITLHGHVAAQLLRIALDGEAPMRPLPEWAELAWLALWCALGAWAGLHLRGLGAFAGAAAAGLAANGAAAWAAFDHGLWLPLLPQSAGWIASLTLVTAYSLHVERTQRGQLMGIFSRYIGGDLATDVWARRAEFLEPGGRPRPQRLTATVLFSDIKGFTAVSETLDAAGLMEWLNSYMEAMASLVMKHGGVVDKFIGDAVMAVFGIPVAKEGEAVARDARAAARCALDMRAGLARFNEEWARRGLPAIGIRVGIYTGELISGSLGSSERMEYTVIGDTVNTASRLESFKLAPGETPPPGALADEADGACRILVGDTTAALLGVEFSLAQIGEVRLKGKAQPVKVYSLIGASA